MSEVPVWEMTKRHEGRWGRRQETERKDLPFKNDWQVAKTWIGEVTAGQSRNHFDEAPGQEVVSRTDEIGESSMRVYAQDLGRHVSQAVLSGKTLGKMCDVSIGYSPGVR